MKKVIMAFILAFLLALGQSGPGEARAEENHARAESGAGEPDLDIVLVMDNSGSMRKNDPEFLAREVVSEFLSGLGENARVGMVVFGEQAELVVGLVSGGDLKTETQFLKSLERINYRGLWSDSPAAIERAIYELKTHGRADARKVIILLTDGIVDTGDKSRDLRRVRWLKEELAQESQESGIRVFGITFANGADFSVIQSLALKTDGAYFRAYTVEDISGVLKEINGLITRPLPEPEKPALPPIRMVAPAPQPAQAMRPVTPAAKAAPQPAAPPVPQREDWYVKVILAGILVILIAIGGILVWNRRTQAVMGAAGLPEEEIAPFPEAELVDVGRVTGQDKFVLEKRITKIGRDKSNDISIPEDTVSSFHATIEYMEGFFYVEDQRSTNKTRLEGEIITPYNPRRLKSGDELMFHTHKFTFMLPDQIPSGETEVDFDPTAATVIQEGPRAPEAPPKEVGPLPQAMLVDVSNVTGKKTFKVLKPITKIGRAGSNDLAVPKDTVSGFHATIEFKEGHFYLEDQRSTNKTFLNGEELAPYTAKRLKSGDEIDLDVCKFIFLLERQYPSGETDQRK